MSNFAEKLQQTNELIHQLMNDKRRMLADLMHVNDEDFDTVAEVRPQHYLLVVLHHVVSYVTAI
jgi:hypothetical protein